MRKFLTAGLLAAITVPVIAQTASAPVAPAAPMADKVMTRAEADAMVRTHFARLDANKDGFVAGDELNRGRKQGGHAGARAKRDPNAAFDRLDSNRDGAISRDEFARGRELRIEKRVARNHGAGAAHPGAKRMRMHRMGGGMMGRHMLRMADANKDGRVSLAEATAGAARHFDMMDSNRDGRVTPEERRAGRVMMRQMRTPAAS